MYSGSTLTRMSGRVLGAHQKIDRIARRHLQLVAQCPEFPAIRAILRFEGTNGPDGIKRKSPAQDEPGHYYDPFDPYDSDLLEIINYHYQELIEALQANNSHRAAFEASWLAHAIVDGLTPAHHYPYEAKLEELRGEGKETRSSIKHKIYIKGDNRRDTIKRNWAFWGAKGLFTTHYMFELGFSTLIAPLRLTYAKPTQQDIKTVLEIGPIELFKRTAREIALLNMYEKFYARGWTPQLARTARRELAPRIVKTVTLAWYCAAHYAGIAR